MRATFVLLGLASASVAAWFFAVAPGGIAAPHLPAIAGATGMRAAGAAGSAAEPQTNEPKVWIVAGLLLPDGNPAFVSFHVPDAPELTLKDCETILPRLAPALQAGIARMPLGGSAKLQAVECFWSASDPIEPAVPGIAG